METAEPNRGTLRGWLDTRRDRLVAFFWPTRQAATVTEDAPNEPLPRRTEPFTRPELRLLAAWRISVVVCVAVALLVLAKSWLHPPRNLALGKPVRSSSRAMGTEPSGAVDGYRYGQLGFHSDNQDSPWLAVDLGAETRLSEVRIYGRTECCFNQSIPLALEVSSDGSTYRELARRTEEFTQYEPWIFTPESPTAARFVRLRTLRKSVLVTSEIEVYGAAP